MHGHSGYARLRDRYAAAKHFAFVFVCVCVCVCVRACMCVLTTVKNAKYEMFSTSIIILYQRYVVVIGCLIL